MNARILFPQLILATAAFAQFRNPILNEAPVRVSDHVQEILGFPNVIFITGEFATLVVDTGIGNANGATVARVARKLSLGKGQRLYLTTTHFHPEHVAGEGGFPQGTVLIRAAVQQKELDEQGMEMLQRFAMNPEWAGLLKDVKTLRRADMTFDRELSIDLGGVTARLLFYGGGHTRGDELIFVEPDSVLVAGDLVQDRVVPSLLTDGSGSSSWLKVLDRIEVLHPRIVVPTHSPMGDGSLIPKERAFLSDMRARTLALRSKGVRVDDAAKQITEQFKTAYPDWANASERSNVASMPNFVRRLYAEVE